MHIGTYEGHFPSNHQMVCLFGECGQSRKNKDILRIADKPEIILQCLTMAYMKEDPMDAPGSCLAFVVGDKKTMQAELCTQRICSYKG